MSHLTVFIGWILDGFNFNLLSINENYPEFKNEKRERC